MAPISSTLPTIECQSCGEVVPVGRKWASVRKYCNVCQIVRDTAQKKAKPCARCKQNFFPLRATWTVCGDCAALALPIVKLKASPVCNICHERRPAALELENTCLGCIQSTEEYRAAYVDKLQKIVAKRKEKIMANFEKDPNVVL